MFVAYMDTTDNLVGITAYGSSNTHIAMIVSASYHTRFIGYTEIIGTVVFPKTVGANMTARSTLIPFQIHIAKILPRIMIFGFMFIGEC